MFTSSLESTCLGFGMESLITYTENKININSNAKLPIFTIKELLILFQKSSSDDLSEKENRNNDDEKDRDEKVCIAKEFE